MQIKAREVNTKHFGRISFVSLIFVGISCFGVFLFLTSSSFYLTGNTAVQYNAFGFQKMILGLALTYLPFLIFLFPKQITATAAALH